MSDFYDEKYRLEGILKDYENAIETVSWGTDVLRNLDVHYQVSKPDTKTNILDYQNRLSQINTNISKVFKKAENKINYISELFAFLNDFYEKMKQIKDLYDSKKYADAISVLPDIPSKFKEDKNELIQDAVLFRKLTNFELNFSLLEAGTYPDFKFVKYLFNAFIKNIDLLNTNRCANIAPLLIDEYLKLGIRECLDQSSVLNFYFANFDSVKTIQNKFENTTHNVVIKYLKVVKNLVDNEFVELFSKKLDIMALIDLQRKVKSFPYRLSLENTILFEEETTLTNKFYGANMANLNSEKLTKSIDFSFNNILKADTSGTLYARMERCSDSLYEVIQPFENNKELLPVVVKQCEKSLRSARYLTFVGYIGIKTGVDSNIFKAFNKPIKDTKAKSRFWMGGVFKYLTAFFGKNKINKKDFTEDQAFAYKLGKKYFNNNNAYIAMKHTNNPEYRKMLKYLGFKVSDDYIIETNCVYPLDFPAITKPRYLRLVQKIVFIIQNVLIGLLIPVFIHASLVVTLGAHLPTFEILTKIPAVPLVCITGALTGLIFLGRAIFVVRQEGKYSRCARNAELQIDIAATVIFSLTIIGLVLYLTNPINLILNVAATASLIMSLFYLATTEIFGFKNGQHKFKNESKLKIANYCLNFIMLVLTLITMFF